MFPLGFTYGYFSFFVCLSILAFLNSGEFPREKKTNFSILYSNCYGIVNLVF